LLNQSHMPSNPARQIMTGAKSASDAIDPSQR
jgi:hypothetical protein